MKEATKKPVSKKAEAPAKTAAAKTAADKPAATKSAPAKTTTAKAAASKTAAEDGKKATGSDTAGKGVKGKGTSTKGPTKSAPGSSEKPKAKPDQQPPSAFSKPLTPTKELAVVLGSDEPLPRTAVVSKVWEYIKKHKLQNESNKREILADANLKPIFEGDKVTMFEMNKYLNKHLKS